MVIMYCTSTKSVDFFIYSRSKRGQNICSSMTYQITYPIEEKLVGIPMVEMSQLITQCSMGTCRVGTSSVEYEVPYFTSITIGITYLFIA